MRNDEIVKVSDLYKDLLRALDPNVFLSEEDLYRDLHIGKLHRNIFAEQFLPENVKNENARNDTGFVALR